MAVTALIILVATVGGVACLVRRGARALIGNRSWPWRLVLTIAGLGYGITSPLRGSTAGHVLIGIGTVAAASTLVNGWRGRWVRYGAQTRCSHSVEHVARFDRRHDSLQETRTELEHARALHHSLHAYVSQLDAAMVGDQPGIAAATAGEVAVIAADLRDTIDVVFAERSQLTSGDRRGHEP